MKKNILAIAMAMASLSLTVHSQTLDLSLSASDWVSGGNTGQTQIGPYGSSGVGVQSATGTQTISCCGPNTWTISPYTGSTMLGMQPGSTANYSTMTTALGLSSSSVSALNTEVASQGGSITSSSWISKNFTFQANTQFKMAWTYTSTDYVPFNDGSLTSLVNTSSATTLAKINGVSAQYLLLGATNPGTGNYSTGSYGSTGWQWVNYDITTAGTYKLGFAIFNQGDTALSPVLFVNDGLGTVTKNGTAFNPVAPNNPDMPTTNPDGTVSGGGTTTPSAPTVVSTTNGTPIVTSSSSNGTPVLTSAVAYGATAVAVAVDNAKGAVTPKTLTVNQTTTVTSTTPFTITNTTTVPVTTVTTTTPTVVKTWSDGTTTTENGTPTQSTAVTNNVSTTTVTGAEIDQAQTQKDYSTRIDQMDYLTKANQRFNQQLDSNPLDRHTVNNGVLISKTNNDDRSGWAYIIADGQRSTTNADGYNMSARRFGVGYEKQVESDLIVGAQFNNIEASLTGQNAGGTLVKNAVGLYGLYTTNDWLLKADAGVASNNYTNFHTLPELAMSNSGKTTGTDYWLAGRAYAPAYEGFRPYGGVRVEKDKVRGFTESGTELTSMNYTNLGTNKTTAEAGVRYENKVFEDKVNLVAEAGRNTNDLSTFKLSASYSPEKNVYGVLSLGQQRQAGIINNAVQANIKMLF